MFAYYVFLLSEMTVGKDQDITVKTKGAGGQGKVGAKVTAPSGKPVTSKVRKGLLGLPAKTLLRFFEISFLCSFTCRKRSM